MNKSIINLGKIEWAWRMTIGGGLALSGTGARG